MPRSLQEMQFCLCAVVRTDFPRPIKVGIYVVLFGVVFLGTSLSSLSAKREPTSVLWAQGGQSNLKSRYNFTKFLHDFVPGRLKIKNIKSNENDINV